MKSLNKMNAWILQNLPYKLTKLFPCLVILLFLTQILISQDLQSVPIITEINDSLIKIQNITINTYNRSISFPAQVKLNNGLIEVLVCKPKGKVHESLFITDINHVDLQAALILLGLNSLNDYFDGNSSKEKNNSLARPDSLMILVQWEDSLGSHKVRAEKFIWNAIKDSQMETCTWIFQGLPMDEDKVQVNEYISMIVTYSDPAAIVVLNSRDKYDDRLFFVNKDFNLPVNKEVQIILQPFN